MQAKQFIFFDLDGTIIDPFEGITGAVTYALKSLGIQVSDPESLVKFIGPPLELSFKEYYSMDDETVKRATTFYREHFKSIGLHANTLYPGIIELFERLTPSKKLVVATSKPEVFAKDITDKWNITKYFERVCGCEINGERSDKALVIAYAMEQCGCKNPQDIIMVGDRFHDIVGAKKNNMQSIGVLYGYGNREELSDAGADYIAETVEGLAQLLCE